MRDIYIKPAKDFRFSKNLLMKLPKPLYGLPGSDDHWHATLKEPLQKYLHMIPTMFDLALFSIFLMENVVG